MAKRKLRIRAARLEPELDRRIEVATKQADFQIPALSFGQRSNENLPAAKAASMQLRSESLRPSTE